MGKRLEQSFHQRRDIDDKSALERMLNTVTRETQIKIKKN